ncbi:polyphenol oxidase family protein, partial [Candidatus Babeliales bacterium]|nr:polyphenol oxidase family protein [Candidatus Babeliales bacterium]
NEPGCAIGVLTADCLPIVLHDEKNNACAVIHAGWRGSVAGIAGKALEAMENSFGTRARDVVAHFGPSAKVCCYEVGEDFAENVCKFLVCRSSRVICEANCIERNDGVFFDNVRLNEFQLFEAGVLADNINKTENKCTICDNSYHSYRRDKGEAGRQATVVLVSFSKG